MIHSCILLTSNEPIEESQAECDEELQEERLRDEQAELELLAKGLMAFFHCDFKTSLQLKGKELLCGLVPRRAAPFSQHTGIPS